MFRYVLYFLIICILIQIIEYKYTNFEPKLMNYSEMFFYFMLGVIFFQIYYFGSMFINYLKNFL